MTIYHSIQELIGHTPLLKIKNFPIPEDVHIYAKLEFLNPGGSVKDRLGVELIRDALSSGNLKPGGTIIEPTAGNTGIGLAIAAKEYDLNVIFCVPEHFSQEKQVIMQALGAEIVHTPKEHGMKGAIEKTTQLLKQIPHSYSPQQFSNQANPNAYYKTLGPEIWNDLEGKVNVFIAGAGTGGTFIGTSKFLKEKNPTIKTIIVEPEGSIIAGGEPGPHRTEGIGMEFLPSYMEPNYFNDIYTVSDDHAFQMVEDLAKFESLLVGSSSGSAMYAALEEAKMAKAGTTIVTVFPDGSDRYISKNIYQEVESKEV
ncbi:PLP-dependent cysteine synthase family protein [Ornithinibacillus halophilus]|uniref:Cystathionine beta-synthase (Acetylserine-dependent) n=1 Tax=Ornithinibacillus halophilus TaxID=930117 RepID=A0A1M5HXW6_9BACI|nr:cysteine synthase family protein [Ornithinibacillus halophilus]SHG20815.1 cystathionine beta-synthase (acetylserine-dependent) [Ornithinibacillus halophilus]